MNGNSCLLFRGLQEACLNWGKPGRHSEIYARMTNSEGHVSKERDRQTDRQTEHHPHAPKKKKKIPTEPNSYTKVSGKWIYDLHLLSKTPPAATVFCFDSGLSYW